jgi:hypothetical protein
LAHSTSSTVSLPDRSAWSHHLYLHHHQHAAPPLSPPPADYDPDETTHTIPSRQDTMSLATTTSTPSFSPLPPDQLTPPPQSPDRQILSYAPFRSSPLATSNTRATIRSISTTGEIEMEDPEEMDLDTPDPEMDSLIPEEMTGLLHSIPLEGVFRAGTPTPVITPPFLQITVPQHSDTSVFEEDAFGVSEGLFEVEEEFGVLEDFLEISHEISAEELDTECFLLSYKTDCSFGCTEEEFLEFVVTISLSKATTSRSLY